MATAGTIIGYAQNQLSFDRSNIGKPGLSEDQLLEICDQAVIEYYEAHRKGGGEPPAMFQKEFGFDLISDSALAEDITSATTDFDIDDSSEFASSGVVAIWDTNEPDYIKYTTNDLATNLSGVTGIGYGHDTDDAVSALYALPSDYNDLRTTQDSPNGVRVNSTPYVHTSGIPRGNSFYIYDDGTTKYLHFAQGLTGKVSVRYNAKPTTISSTSIDVDIPAKDQWFAVWRIIEHAAPLLGKIDMYNIAVNRAQQILSNALITRNISKRPKVRPMRIHTFTTSNADYR